MKLSECSDQKGAREANDIAILKLSTPIEKSDTIDYARLPAADRDVAGNSAAIVAGWGYQTPIGVRPQDDKGRQSIRPENLSKVVVDVLARKDCIAKYKYQNIGDRDTIICAGGQGKNACRGG
ncbi:hypothetical protein J3459_008663 [Metarhizium acridum]|nr:hypothetical protein J3459_008663 [Metarhizium acridum]